MCRVPNERVELLRLPHLCCELGWCCDHYVQVALGGLLAQGAAGAVVHASVTEGGPAAG